MSRTSKIAVAAAVVVALVAASVWLPVAEGLRTVVEWTRDLGPLGVVVYSAVFIVVCLSLLPTVELYIAAGFLYGTWWGALLTTVLGVIVELLTLWLVHGKLRTGVETRIARYPRLAALDRGISEHPFWIVQLLRISPLVPFAPLNYALALTKIPLWQRIVANVIGMGLCAIPQTYVGSLLKNVGQLREAGPPSTWTYVGLVVGIATAIGAAALTAWASKRALGRAESA